MGQFLSNLRKSMSKVTIPGQALTMRQFEKEASRKLKSNTSEGYVAVKFDVDRFAELKSRYGSEQGEQLLGELTKALAQHQSKTHLFARTQSGKFLILAKNQPDFLLLLQSELASAVKNIGLEKYIGVVNFSFGVYEIIGTEETVDGMLDKVGLAHKIAGKSKYKSIVWYDETLTRTIAQENYYNEHLPDAIANEEFKVYLQRQVELSDLNKLRAKALLRWVLPDSRIIYPDSFIPQFEKNGMMVHLDFYVLEKVCQYLQEMKTAGEAEMTIVVNISSVTMFAPNFQERVLEILAQYQISPQNIVLELQQASLLGGQAEVLSALTALTEQGVMLSAQVVTTGHSNLSLLAELPVQILKIDRHFVRAVDNNKKTEVIMQAIITMAHNLSMQVICEGVEHLQDVQLLYRLQCDLVQGYFLMKAVPKEDFLRCAFALNDTIQERLERD